jgi:hypothetical protein
LLPLCIIIMQNESGINITNIKRYFNFSRMIKLLFVFSYESVTC